MVQCTTVKSAPPEARTETDVSTESGTNLERSLKTLLAHLVTLDFAEVLLSRPC